MSTASKAKSTDNGDNATGTNKAHDNSASIPGHGTQSSNDRLPGSPSIQDVDAKAEAAKTAPEAAAEFRKANHLDD